MAEKNERDFAERWFVALTRIASGPMRRTVANLLAEFGINPIDDNPKPRQQEAITHLIPDTPLQLTDAFKDRLEHNLAKHLCIDRRFIETKIERHGTELWAIAKILPQEES